MDWKWKHDVARLSKRSTEKEFDQFVALVLEAQGSCTLEDCKVLLETYHDDLEDYGSQEVVTAIIFSAGETLALQAILEELPRLMDRAPNWVCSMVNPVLLKRPSVVLNVARMAGPEQKGSLERLLAVLDQDGNSNAKLIARELK